MSPAVHAEACQGSRVGMYLRFIQLCGPNAPFVHVHRGISSTGRVRATSPPFAAIASPQVPRLAAEALPAPPVDIKIVGGLPSVCLSGRTSLAQGA